MKNVPVTYYQEILEKISHADKRTFRKELRKAFKRLLPAEREELKQWFRNACLCRPELLQPVPVERSRKDQLK